MSTTKTVRIAFVAWSALAAGALASLMAARAQAQTAPPAFEAPSASAQAGEVPAAAAAPPAAASRAAPAPAGDGIGMFVGLKIGGLFPQPFSKLGSAVAPELELGLHVWQRRLAVFADLGYAQPGASGTVADPRVPDGSYHWTLTERDLTTSLGLLLRLEWLPIVPYFGAGVRLHLQESVVNGSAGAAKVGFGENRETATRAGGIALVGGELKLGPGALLAEIEAGYAGLDHKVTGPSNEGGIAARLGFRLFF